MTRRLLALPLIVALAAACADTTSPLEPKPAAKNTTTYTFGVKGNTTGPRGEFWMVTGSESVCATHYWTYYTVGGGASSSMMSDVCRPSALSTYDVEAYVGGQISVNVYYNGEVKYSGGVNADMSQVITTYDLPAGATVVLEAYPNPGCQLSYWHAPNFRTDNPIVLDASQVGQATGWFNCSGSGGSGGPGGGGTGVG